MNDPVEELRRLVIKPESSLEYVRAVSAPKIIIPVERLMESLEERRMELLKNKLGYLRPRNILELFNIPWESRKYIQKMHRDHILEVVYPNIKTHQSTYDDFLFLEATKMLNWITTSCPAIMRSFNENRKIMYRNTESNDVVEDSEFNRLYNDDIIYSGYDLYMNVVLCENYTLDEDIEYHFSNYCYKHSLSNFKKFNDITHINEDINYLSFFMLQFEHVVNNLEEILLKLTGKDSIYKFAPLAILWSYVRSETDPINMSSNGYSLSN